MTSEVLTFIQGISTSFISLFLVLYFLHRKYIKKLKDFVLPNYVVIVQYDKNNYVIMNEERTKFLTSVGDHYKYYWKDEIEIELNSVYGSQMKVKQHAIAYCREKVKFDKQKEIENKLKSK